MSGITVKVAESCLSCGFAYRRISKMMKRLRRTLSFRSRSKYRANNNPANWENDSINIKHGGLSFPAKVSDLFYYYSISGYHHLLSQDLRDAWMIWQLVKQFV